MQRRTAGLIFIALLLSGCFLQDPMVDKHLYARNITKAELSELKTTIESLGYDRGSREDYAYEGAYVTTYFKYVGQRVDQNLVQITLTFKTENLDEGYYRNFNFSVASVDPHGSAEIIAEIDATAEAIKKKLIALVGAENTEPPSTHPTQPTFSGKWRWRTVK